MIHTALLLSDLGVLHFFNGSESAMLDQLMLVFTSGLTWIPLYLSFFYIIVRNNETMSQIGLAVLGALLCVALADGITDGVVKPLVARWRPNNDPIVKYTIQVVGNLRGSGYGFFSAHAANTMSLAVFLALLFRSKLMTIALVAWSLLNCYTRLYLGMHYPSDILCGLFAGAVIGVLVYVLYLKLYYKISPRITYVSSQYTSTGYDRNDIDLVLTILYAIGIYAVLRSIVMASMA